MGIGVVQSIVLVGGLLGSLLVPWLQPKFRPPVLIIAMSWLGAALVGVTAILPGSTRSPSRWSSPCLSARR
ncbi:hypothetical protein [Actinopolymorpha alba]|uniref:hypothetical protein n=1 Tax=Actinopolymorpha alba TaxID=533267 RepID=UPI00035E6EAC|nr:hypothetical protein [Actinopolymorpha alba]